MAEKEIRVLALQPEVRAGADGVRKIAGYAVKWQQSSSPLFGLWIERFQPGAFARSLKDHYHDIFATWQHDVRDTIGRTPSTLSVREDEVGLFYEITPPKFGERFVESIERGDVRGSSFTFRALVEEWDYDSDPNFAIRSILEAELFEVAPVTNPAFPQSTAGVRSDKELAEFVRQEREKHNAALSSALQQKTEFIARQKALRDLLISPK